MRRSDNTGRAEESLRRHEERSAFLAEASEVLSSSLDYRTTLASVARLSVPTLADWCAVDIVGDDGSVERLAVEYREPEKIELAYKLEERLPPDSPGGIHEAIRTGRPQMMSEIPAELLADEVAPDGERGETLGKPGLRSYMVAPLVARGKTLGAITFVTAESVRTYREADLELAEELAHRAALAMDNAWLYEEAQREIAERRWAQEELRGSKEQLEIILRGVTDGIIAHDSGGRLFYANDAAARMSGYPSAKAFVDAPPSEVLGKFEILDAEGRPFPLEKLPGRRALRGEVAVEEVLRFRVLETGAERWSVVRATPVFDEEERQVRMVVSIMRDITEQRRAQQERTRLAAIVESSDDAIISKTLDGIIMSWNRGAQRIYGYSPEEIVGQHISVLAPPEISDEITDILAKLRRGEKIEHYETVRVTKAGRKLDVSLTISPIRDSAGNVTGASTIARDITERKRTENALQEIREAERHRLARDLHDGALQDLAYTTAALGLITLNARDAALEEELQGVIEVVRRAARGLRDAVNDLRLDQDRPFVELVESMVKLNRAMARGREVNLEVAGDFPSTPLGETGRQMLRVIQEALTNARRHSGARSILVSLKPAGRDLVVEVSDEGKGFEPGTAPGVGLGSMRERAAIMGGELEIESDLGRGTRIRLRVPSPPEG